ncbi:MAG: hypothetical protein ACK46X_02170 [Candidatus Sericytochromatia bacterium]
MMVKLNVLRALPLLLVALAAAPFTLQPQALAGPPIAPPPAKETVYWQGTSAGHAIRWTNRDLTFAPGGFSLRKASLQEHSEMDAGCESAHTASLLSVVGPIVSRQEGRGGFCPGTAHPYAERTMAAVDLSKGAKPASLEQYFPSGQILSALLADRIIQQALSGEARPKTLGALIGALEGKMGPECAYGFSSDMLSRYAFHHVKGNRVAVRIGLSHGCEANRGGLTQLGVYLPIPASLAAPLKAAATGKQGFLMERAPDQMTAFQYGQSK